MKAKHFTIILFILLVICFIWHIKQYKEINNLNTKVDSLVTVLMAPSVGIPCPAKGATPSSCPAIPVATASTAFYVDTCIGGYYKSFNNFCGFTGGTLRNSQIVADYKSDSTFLNCLSYSFIFVPNTGTPASSTMTVKFRLDNYNAGTITKGSKAPYFSEWLCPTYCPTCITGASCAPTPTISTAPISVHTEIGGVKYYTNFCGSNGGSVPMAELMNVINSNPGNYNCITYSFVFVPDLVNKQNSRMGLKFHLNRYDAALNKISVLPGADYPSGWLCPTNCPPKL